MKKNKIFETLQDLFNVNFQLVLVGIYFIGFAYQFFFYRNFNIKIENYLSLTDLIFVAINLITENLRGLIAVISVVMILFLIASLLIRYLLFPIFYFFKDFVYQKDHKVSNLYDEWFDRYIFVVIGVILGVLTLYFYSIRDFSSVISLLFLSFFVGFKIINNFKFSINRLLFTLIIIFFLSILYSTKIEDLADEIKKGESDVIVSFEHNNKVYSTDIGDVNFIGETSNFVFLYEMELDQTLVFNKQMINNYIVTTSENSYYNNDYINVVKQPINYGELFVKSSNIKKSIIRI